MSAVPIRNLVPFALAGISLVGVVVDEIDVSHDDLQSAAVLGAGAAAGLLAAVVIGRRAATEEQAARARGIAWDVVRFFLAFEMVRYGTAKVVGMQFYRQYWRLDVRSADLRPMSLAWVFFGRSYGYQLAAGILEVASGVLVCFRRTTLLGACIMATALVNVVLVDFFYDVNVRLFASLYLALDLSLIARDAPRLRALFLAPSTDPPASRRTRLLRAVLVALVLGLPAAEIVREAYGHGIFRKDALEGAWTVERRAGLDDLLPEAPGPWDRVYFEKGDFGSIRIGKARVSFASAVDERARTLRLSKLGQSSSTLAGTFELRDPQLRVDGSCDGKPFSLELTRELPR